jgi:hypothetical protein
MKVAKSTVKGLFILSFIMCAIYCVTSGSVWSLGGLIGCVLASVFVWLILCVALSPIILIAGIVGKALGF